MIKLERLAPTVTELPQQLSGRRKFLGTHWILWAQWIRGGWTRQPAAGGIGIGGTIPSL